ncbi:MAG: serine/threonine-protein kinase, partial [Pseudomonadota bacterium]
MTTVDLDELLTPGGGLRVMQSLAADGEPPDAMIGTELAAYTIESRLGTGGMSTVYAGRRTDGEYEHAVAIKLMRNVDPDARSQQRLRLERQILADLSHPNIARLIDGGVAPDGRPYLVMERIDGLPIDRFCARNGLDLVERIKLFTQVVRALEHAHASAVIHRDIKPSNILVTASGTAKLLDFGIAKTVDEATQETERLLTLTFASPEQLDGERITVATDIYQLGIVLYLLVTGSNPFGEPTDPQRQVVLAVTTSAPERPSQRLQRIGKGREARRVRGDLDAIILKCLRRDPDERYESARALLNDLKAFRKAKPVDARAGGFGYSVSRLLARNRLATAIAAVGFLAVLAVLVVSFANISAARNEALARAQTAERVQALTREILGAASPYAEEEPGSTRELLAAWEREVRVTLAAEPAVQADLLHLIGSAQLQQGWPGEATDSLAAALAVAPPNTPLRARVLTSMASLALDRDEVDAALDRLEEARPWLTPPDRARWHALQGNALARTSRIDAALTHYAAAADEFEALGSAYQDQFVSALVEWAGALVFAEQPREAAEVMERALGGSSRPLSLQGLRLADALEDYGGVLGINSRWRTALEV